MFGKRDHFNVLIFCAVECELQAAKRVLENQTNIKFINKYDDLSQFNVMVCEEWNSTPLKVAITAQARVGGIECRRHVSELGKYFSANVVVMTGTCAGDENKYGNVEYGSVVIARQTTAALGGKEKSTDEFQTSAENCGLNRRIAGAIDQLVEEGSLSRMSADWVKYVPDDMKRPSPRLVRELILECVFDNPNIMKSRLLQKLESKNLPGMCQMNYTHVLEIMQEQEHPWIRAEGKFQDEYVVTGIGEEYVRTEAGFLRDDVIIGILDSMAAIPKSTESLKEQMKILKKQAANRKLRGVDMESHNFMQQAVDSFAVDDKPGIGVVMKGISDYGSQKSKLDYYQAFAASTSAAFLRHLMTEKQYLFGTRMSDRIVSVSHSTSSGGGEEGTRFVPSDIKDLIATIDANAVIQAVTDSGADLWFDIGQRLGFNIAHQMALTVDKVRASSKLRALITAKQAQLGNAKAMELLLSTCQDVSVYDLVLEYLREG